MFWCLQYFTLYTDPVHFLCDSIFFVALFTCVFMVYRSCTFSLWLFTAVFIINRSCTFSLWSCLKYFSLFTDPVHFLCGPVYSIIHCLQILYIFFVGLFTYFLLVDYQFYEITTIEIVCIVWIFTFIVDELYTVSLLNFSVTYSQVLKCKIYT